MLLLALDTSTPHVSVALHDGARTLAERRGEQPMRHGEQLAPAIAAVLAESGAESGDLTRIAVGVGPGPYTGLRVGVVTAQVLADALAIEVAGVCSLDALAATARAAGTVGRFVAASDARRREVYWARYDHDGRRLGDPAVDTPATLAGSLAVDEVVVGRGARMYADVLPAADGPDDPAAGAMATVVVAGAVELRDLTPLYLRRPDAREPTPRR